MSEERSGFVSLVFRIGRPIGLVLALASALGSGGGSAHAFEYGFLTDMHLSIRDELSPGESFQLDNYYALDAYRVRGFLDFHSSFRITNDLNFHDAEAAQLTMAYVKAERLLDRWGVSAGRQFFLDGFGAFLGDGLRVDLQDPSGIGGSLLVCMPFDVENEEIRTEPLRAYGGAVRYRALILAGVPVKTALQIVRRDYTDEDIPDQTLIGTETSVGLSWPVESDLYGDLEIELDDSRVRRAKIGALVYLTPRVSIRAEGERYEPEQRYFRRQSTAFLQDTIMKYFARGEVATGKFAVEVNTGATGIVTMSYSGQRYFSADHEEVFGHLIDLYAERMVSRRGALTLGAGYAGRVANEDYIHLLRLRAGTRPDATLGIDLLAEAGILSNRFWDREPVAHLRGAIRSTPRPNVEISLVLEENVNPYFDSDLRGILLLRYFWMGRTDSWKGWAK